MTGTSNKALLPKRLILCLDGTWNDADDKYVTSIVRIRDLIEPGGKKDPSEPAADYQRIYYDSGVGAGLSMWKKRFAGLTGAGLHQNIRTAYRFLSQHYHKDAEIYIFGFSRGAFTARSLASYIATSGLLRPELCTPQNEKKAWQYYRCHPDRRFPSRGEALEKLCFDKSILRIRAIGVFDTVGALGIPLGLFRLWNRQRYQFHNVQLSSIVDYAFHAVAIDEKRGPFHPSLWQYPNHRDFDQVEQVWFPGVHADVGGGYEDRSASTAPLRWMLSRIEKETDLKFIDDWRRVIECRDSGKAVLHESRTPIYYYSRLEPRVRVINQQPPKWRVRLSALAPHAIPLGEMVHISALRQWRNDSTYRPENLETVLYNTFESKPPRPTPIVDDDGILDWIKNDKHWQKLRETLTSHYTTQAGTMRNYVEDEKIDSSIFSSLNQGPSKTHYAKAHPEAPGFLKAAE